jgi:hypothetical protein
LLNKLLGSYKNRASQAYERLSFEHDIKTTFFIRLPLLFFNYESAPVIRILQQQRQRSFVFGDRTIILDVLTVVVDNRLRFFFGQREVW